MFNMKRCVVEDNKDPLRLGRVRIRVQGVHSARLDEVKTEELPWSEVLNPIDAGNTLGSSTNVLIGTWGFCVPMNEAMTEFLFMGTVKGVFNDTPLVDAEDNEIGFRDPSGRFPVRTSQADNPLTYGERLNPDITRERVLVGPFTEPKDTATNSTYPDNKVYEDHNGNIVEIDGTNENSRIRIQHSSGARVEINTKGDVTIQASSTGNVYQETPGLFAIGAAGNLIIQADVKIIGSVECTGEVTDLLGNMSSIRAQLDANVATQNGNKAVFDAHVHATSPAPSTQFTNEAPDPLVKFIWSGNPL